MYVHSAFRTDMDQALALLRGRAFGSLAVADAAGVPVAVHVPFLTDVRADGGLSVTLHVARANTIHDVIGDEGRPALLICTGPDAYISPDWYGLAQQVPTWTYAAVHLTGHARRLPGAASLAHLERLSAQFENRLLPKPPWTIGKLEPHRVDALLRALVPIELVVEPSGIAAQLKLSQHKGADAMKGAMVGLHGTGDAQAAAVAALMQQLLDSKQS